MNWINIKDELPTDQQEVVYYFKPLGVFRGKYKKVENDEFAVGAVFDCFYGDRGYLCDDVTHWMPDREGELPEPPEEGK
ncbi:MAG: DUF551 domain-containing protein [Syntrophales bacterium]|nr:DUF551 domain-containing protein [Syntrophales bacterium]